MRPDTVARRAREHTAERDRARAERAARLAALANDATLTADERAFWSDLAAECSAIIAASRANV